MPKEMEPVLHGEGNHLAVSKTKTRCSATGFRFLATFSFDVTDGIQGMIAYLIFVWFLRYQVLLYSMSWGKPFFAQFLAEQGNDHDNKTKILLINLPYFTRFSASMRKK